MGELMDPAPQTTSNDHASIRPSARASFMCLYLGPGVLALATLALAAELLGVFPSPTSSDVPSARRTWGVVVLAVGLLLAFLWAWTQRRRWDRLFDRCYQDRFTAHADLLPAMLWTVRPDSMCDYLNRAWLDYCGRAMETQLGHGWLEVVHPDDRDPCRTTFLSAFEQRKPFHLYYRLRRADGTYRRFVASATPTNTQAGAFSGYLGVSIDIEEQASAVDRLRESEERYRGIVEDQTELICRWTPEGVITFVNEAYCRTFGRHAREIIGHSFAPMIPEEDRHVMEEVAQRLGPKEPIVTSEHRVIVADGSVRWHRWTDRVLLDQSGRVVEYQGVGADITESKVAELSARQANERLAALLTREAELRRELNHRVRNNLASLLGLVTLYTRSTVTVPELAEAIRGKVAALREVHELISASSGGADLASLVSRLAGTFAKFAPGAGRITVHGPTVLLPPELASAMAMIIQELLTNSVKHGALVDPEGKITLEWAVPSEGPGLSLVWRERVPPRVALAEPASDLSRDGTSEFPPEHGGVGLSLVKGLASFELRGDASFSFEPAGLVCRIRIGVPLDLIQAPSKPSGQTLA